jgi:hypothetical protein
MRIYRLMITCIRLGAFPLLRDTLRFDSVIGKGIEPHPTDEYHSVFFLTTLRLMERPLSLTQPCREK